MVKRYVIRRLDNDGRLSIPHGFMTDECVSPRFEYEQEAIDAISKFLERLELDDMFVVVPVFCKDITL